MDTDQIKKEYEVAFIARNEAGAEVVLKALKSLSAEIAFEGPVSRIPLAYKIENEAQGDFGYVQFLLEADKINALDHTLKAEPSLLRFLILTSPLMKQKAKAVATKPRAARTAEARPPEPLSNEALEKKIEEILK